MNEKDKEYLEKLYLRALNFLSYKPRSENEVRIRLKKYLFKSKRSQDQKDTFLKEIIGRLIKDGYLDEAGFVKSYVENYLNSHRSKSVTKLRFSLLKKGFDKDLINLALSNIPSETEDIFAYKDAEKKLCALKKYPKNETRSRLYRYLAQKGYTQSSIKSAIDRLTLKQ